MNEIYNSTAFVLINSFAFFVVVQMAVRAVFGKLNNGAFGEWVYRGVAIGVGFVSVVIVSFSIFMMIYRS